MEKVSKRASPPKKGKRGGGKSPGDSGPRAASPRSKFKDKNPQPGSAERRYKEMLHTTAHIYQPGAAGGLSENSEETLVSNQGTQTNAKDKISAHEERIHPPGSVLPEEITAHVPLTEIMSRDQPLTVINAVNLPETTASQEVSNVVQREKIVEVESSVNEEPLDNSVNHNDQDEQFSKGGSTSCRRHSSVYTDSKQKVLMSRPKLCESCTVSMLSYIAVLRDMLDEVTNEITNQEDQSIQCAECVKERVIQENQLRTPTSTESMPRRHTSQRPHDLPISKQSQKSGTIGPSNDVGDSGYSQTPMSVGDSGYSQASMSEDQQPRSLPTLARPDADSGAYAPSENAQDVRTSEYPSQSHPESSSDRQVDYGEQTDFTSTNTDGHAPRSETRWTEALRKGPSEQRRGTHFERSQVSQKHRDEGESRVADHSEIPMYLSDQNRPVDGTSFNDTALAHLARPGTLDMTRGATGGVSDSRNASAHEKSHASTREDLRSPTSPFFREGSDGILSTLSNEEREVYDSARGRAGWDRLTEWQEFRDTSFGPSSTEEAFVTMATTNAEAISSLVLGSSLLLCRTTRTLCILITDGVSPSLRAPLSSVFQVVQSVRSLDTVGTTKVALLDQPELGIFFRKLHVWRLAQFSKCVFLNPDTLVTQNCDELFCHAELSAVPDIGWPDCFNSGVFVFQPSVETFWKLVQFAESEGSYDGGDQGLLNAFFKNWSNDIHKKLSFIYNLMANVSYTYTPAFRQFGRNVKIVQFQGAFKPWHVKFYTGTGQISPSTAVHPTYVQFVHVWLNIFRVKVLPLFSQDIQAYASSQNIINASELLKFFPSPLEVEADFLLTPPSVRVRADAQGISKPPPMARRHSIGSNQELIQQPTQPDDAEEHRTGEESHPSHKTHVSIIPGDEGASNKDTEPVPAQSKEVPEQQMLPSSEETEESKSDVPEDEGSRRSSIPGSEIGDYQGMAAWEQGRMDYMGSACSENIIKRLHFLMDKSSDQSEE